LGLREIADDTVPKISAFDPQFAGPNGKPDEKKIAEYITAWEEARKRVRGGEDGLSRYDELLCSFVGQLVHEASVGRASNYMAWPRGERYDEIAPWKWNLYSQYWTAVDAKVRS